MKMEKSKLRNLLGKGRSGVQKKKLKTGFKDAILKLIDQNQDLNGVLEELKDDQQNSDQEQEDADVQGCSHFSVDSLLNLMKNQSHRSGIPLSVLSARICAQNLSQMIQNTAETHCIEQKSVFWPVSKKGNLEVILKTMKYQSHDLSSFDRSHFLDQIKKVPLPLELIWLLHKESAVTFDIFIKANLGHGETFKKLTKDFTSVILTDFTPEKKDVCQNIVSDLIVFLITNAYPVVDSVPGSSHERALQEAYQLLLSTIFNGVYDQCQSSEDSQQLFLQVSWFKGGVPESSLKQFLKIQLSRFLSHKPVWTVSDAITQQGEWCSAKTDGFITQLFKEFTYEMETWELIEILKRTLEEEEVNWRITLMFASFLLVNSSDSKTDFKELLDYFLKEAFESVEQESLITAFLLARQAASEGTHLFMSYENWFKVTFCQSNNQIFSSRKEVMFLLSFLNNLVPFESAQYLKVHVQHATFIPSKFKGHLDDYISLAKTRLQDLGVPWDASGIFKPKPDEGTSSTKVKNPIEVDINRAVQAFEEKGKIPPAVIQAVMFRRKYYHTYFLPALLTPRMLPDIPDGKMKLILALKEANKIPAEMYQEYEVKCGQMLNDLLEGAFTEEAMEEVQAPMDALKGDMEKLANIVKNGWTGDDLRRQLTVISDGLKTMLVKVDKMSDMKVVDLEQAVMDKNIAEVVDVLLAGFSSIESTAEIREGQRSLQWLEPFVTMLGGHSALHVTLIQKMWSSVTEKEEIDSSKEEEGTFTSFFVGIQICQDVYPKVKLPGMEGVHSVLEAAAAEIFISQAEGMAAALRFLTAVLACFLNVSSNSDVILSNIVPTVAVHKFLFLVERFKNCEKHRRARWITDTKFEETLCVYRSEKFKMLMTSKGNIRFEQWIKWELEVAPHCDILCDYERHNYHHLVLMGDFLPSLERECCNTGTSVYWKAASIIVNAIMDWNRGQYLNLKEDKSEMAYSSQREIVQLLAELLSMLPSEQRVSQTMKCQLISIFDDRQDAIREGGLDAELMPSVVAVEMDSFVRLVLSLPPPFTLTNHITQNLQEGLLNHLAKFLEENRQHLMVNSSYLPYLLTAHIFKGFIILSSSNKSWNLHTALAKIFDKCPLFKISVMVHWLKLKPLTLMGSMQSVTIKQVEAVHQWVDNSTSDSVPSLRTPPSEDGFFLSASLLITLHQKEMQFTDKLLNFICENPKHEVFQALAELFVCEIAWHLSLGEYSYYCKRLVEMMRMDYTRVLPLFTGQSPFRRQVCHPSSESLYPVVFFKLLEKGNSPLWSEKQMLSSTMLLTTALECHIKLRDTYLLGGTSVQKTTDTDEVLSVGFLAACNNIMNQLINLTSPAGIQNLSDALIKRSSREIQSYLRRKGIGLSS